MSEQTIEQQRACFALDKVKELENQSHMKEFKSYANALPVMIHQNGLGQAVAFCKSKSTKNDAKSKAYKALYELLENWLTKENQPYQGEENLLSGITTKDMHQYRIAQVEAIALLSWVKKFANAFAKEEKPITHNEEDK